MESRATPASGWHFKRKKQNAQKNVVEVHQLDERYPDPAHAYR
jgi:hypothetical protein